MRRKFGLALTAAACAVFSGAMSAPASAACQRLGFTVNDYGKDGPTKDAKSLLDKHIAKKMAERGITKFNTGAKSVKCELFLNLIVFDEHTCTAEATVCWDGAPLPKSETTAAVDKKADKPAAAPAAKADKATLKTTAGKPKAEATAKPAAAPTSTDAPAAAPAAKNTGTPAWAAEAKPPAQ